MEMIRHVVRQCWRSDPKMKLVECLLKVYGKKFHPNCSVCFFTMIIIISHLQTCLSQFAYIPKHLSLQVTWDLAVHYIIPQLKVNTHKAVGNPSKVFKTVR